MAVDRAGIALEGSLEGSCEGRVGAWVTGLEIGNGAVILVSSGVSGGGGVGDGVGVVYYFANSG